MKLFYPLFAFLIFLLIAILKLNGFFITVESNSMQPALSKGDMAYISYENEYFVGDVIVFSYENQTYIHRIALNENGYYRTKGDNSLNLDRWSIEKKDIFGKMVFKLPYIGRIPLKLAGKM